MKATKRKKQFNAARLITGMVLLLLSAGSRAQTLADTIYNETAAINKAYDSAFYLTFDIRMDYISDTIYAGTDSADFTVSQVTGTYTFFMNNALYKLDNIEYMQNDSFAIAVYNDEKFILVGKPPAVTTGSFMPMKAMLDSLLANMQQSYMYKYHDYDSVRQISYQAIDPYLPYEMVIIEYEPGSYHLLNISVKLKHDQGTDAGSFGGPVLDVRKANLYFRFMNYRVDQVNETVFSEDKYLFFDGPNEIKPASAYKDYVIYKNY